MPDDNGIEYLARVFTDPIIAYPPVDKDSIPEQLRYHIQIERLAQAAKTPCSAKIEEATDAEAMAYMMTASFVAPLNHEGYGIYTHLFGKYAESAGLQVLDDLKEDIERYRQLDRHLESQLHDLKRWLQKQKDRHYKQKRSDWEYRNDETQQVEKPGELTLNLFDETV